MNWRDHLVVALGYHELGMHQDGLDELERLTAKDLGRLEVILIQLSILQSIGNWKRGAEIARDAVQSFSKAGDLYMVGAYCIRRSENIDAAFGFLENGKGCLEEEPCFWFNLGCYHCQLGRLEDAKRCVERAIELDGKYRKMASEDEDLKPLSDSWKC